MKLLCFNVWQMCADVCMATRFYQKSMNNEDMSLLSQWEPGLTSVWLFNIVGTNVPIEKYWSASTRFSSSWVSRCTRAGAANSCPLAFRADLKQALKLRYLKKSYALLHPQWCPLEANAPPFYCYFYKSTQNVLKSFRQKSKWSDQQ